MAWQNGHYYRKRWIDGTCVSEHVGSGVIGRMAELLDERERMQRKAKAEQYKRMVKADKALRDEVREIGAIVRDLTKLVLLVDGYHQHKRQWRRDSMAETVRVNSGQIARDGGATNDETAEIMALLRRMDAGNPTSEDRQQLAKHLSAIPGLAAAIGDMSLHVVDHMLKKMHGQPTMRQAAGVHFINMRDELGYENANPLEQSMIMHIIVCWFRLQYVESQYSLHTFGQHDMREAAYWDKRLSASQRRYLRAVESLARVRKLLTPDSPTVAVMMQQNVNVGSD